MKALLMSAGERIRICPLGRAVLFALRTDCQRCLCRARVQLQGGRVSKRSFSRRSNESPVKFSNGPFSARESPGTPGASQSRESLIQRMGAATSSTFRAGSKRLPVAPHPPLSELRTLPGVAARFCRQNKSGGSLLGAGKLRESRQAHAQKKVSLSGRHPTHLEL